MAISLIGQLTVPATDNTSSTGMTVTFDKDNAAFSGMAAGDTIFVYVVERTGARTWSVTTTGGQSWTEVFDEVRTGTHALYTAVFNGTWTADPVFTVSGASGVLSGWMWVLRGVDSAIFGNAPITAADANDQDFATFNTVVDDAWAIWAGFETDDNTCTVDNSAVALDGTASIYRRNTGTGSTNDELTIVIARKVIPTAGATGAATLNYSANDPGGKWYASIKPYVEPPVPVDVSDAATAADVVTYTASMTGDDASVSDEVSTVVADLPVSDSAIGDDVATVSVPISVTDAAVGADTSAVSVPVVATDSGVGADISILTAAYPVTETATGADASVLTAAYPATDTASGADASVLTAALPRTDAASGADASVLTAAYPVTETASGADSSALTASLVATEAGTASDTSSVTTGAPTADTNVRGRVGELTLTGVTGDTFNITGLTSGDRVTLLVAFQPQEAAVLVVVTDAGVASDTAALTAVLAVADSGSGADASALTATLVTTDTGSGVDSVPTLAKTVTDAGSVADASVLTAAYSAIDTASGADSVPSMAKVVTEAGTASDTSSVLTGAAVSANDSGTASDTVTTLTAVLVASDVAAGVDSILSLSRPVADSATASDAVTTLDAGASNMVSDTGTASDVAVLTAAAFLVTDAGTAVDSAVVLIAPSTGTITSPLPSLIQAISAASLAPVQDSFNRANGAIGVSDTGHTWITQAGVWSISANRAFRSDTAGLVQGTVVVDSGMTTCSLSVDATFFPGFQDAGVVFADIDDNNYLLFSFSTTAGPISELRLWKRDAGTFTLLSGPHTVAGYANTTKLVRVEWDATTGAIELWFGGTLIAALTLSSGDRTKYAAGTRQGLREFSSSLAEKTYFDNYNLVEELLPAATVSNTLPTLSTLVMARHANTTDWSDPAADTTFSGVGTQVVVVTAGV